MNRIFYKGIRNIFAIGDCHGEIKSVLNGIKKGLYIKPEDEEKPNPKEIEIRERRLEAERNALRARYGFRFDDNIFEPNIYTTISKKKKVCDYENSLFIISGDCGIGFNTLEYYEKLFTNFNKILEYNNTYVIFIRGNHDNPAYFDGNTINLSNIKAVPDYSVIETELHNILCIGGAISIDRLWRKAQEKRINKFRPNSPKKLYWEKESTYFDKNAIDEITDNIKIDIVISHSSPSFTIPEKNNSIEDWSKDDADLLKDICSERIVLDKIFNELRDKGSQPKYWVYSHFDINYIERRSDTIFRALPEKFNPINIECDINNFIQMEKAESGKKKLSKKIKLQERIDEDYNQLNNHDPFDHINFLNGMDGANGRIEEFAVNEAVEAQQINEAVEGQPINEAVEGQPINVYDVATGQAVNEIYNVYNANGDATNRVAVNFIPHTINVTTTNH